MYLVPKINLFHALKLGPQSRESANFFNKSWVINGTMIVEEYLGTYDGEARCPPMIGATIGKLRQKGGRKEEGNDQSRLASLPDADREGGREDGERNSFFRQGREGWSEGCGGGDMALHNCTNGNKSRWIAELPSRCTRW